MIATPKTRRFRFSLRALLALVLVCSVPLAWLALELQRARRQREAVEALQLAGCDVYYDYQLPEEYLLLVGPDESAKPQAPAWLVDLLGVDVFANVIVVNAVTSNPTRITDKEMTYLGTLDGLEALLLYGSTATDAGLTHLVGLTNLEHLSLGDTHITDSGLECLASLPKLEHLFFNGTEVTDRGLEHLSRLTHLRWLHLVAPQVTDEGIEKLRRALPNCRVTVVQTVRPSWIPSDDALADLMNIQQPPRNIQYPR